MGKFMCSEMWKESLHLCTDACADVIMHDFHLHQLTLSPCSSGVPCLILDLIMDSQNSEFDVLWCLEGKGSFAGREIVRVPGMRHALWKFLLPFSFEKEEEKDLGAIRNIQMLSQPINKSLSVLTLLRKKFHRSLLRTAELDDGIFVHCLKTNLPKQEYLFPESHWGIDGGEEDVGLEGSRGYFSRILASEKYRKANDRELLVDLSFREGTLVSQHGNVKHDNYLLSNTTTSLANVQRASLVQISGQLEDRNNDPREFQEWSNKDDVAQDQGTMLQGKIALHLPILKLDLASIMSTHFYDKLEFWKKQISQLDYFPQGTFKPQLNMKRFVILHLQQLTLKNQKFAYETRSSVSVIIGGSLRAESVRFIVIVLNGNSIKPTMSSPYEEGGSKGIAECATDVPGPPWQGVLNTLQAQPTSKLRPGGIIQDMIFPDVSRHSQTPSPAQELASDIKMRKAVKKLALDIQAALPQLESKTILYESL
ncbi:hypothetical protein Q9966_014724 [Columba livia]|nr:hypothetical protein Q9966_014724 [Columba livia]